MHTYPGNIHIHTSYSDGSGRIDEIAAAASAAGLRYIIIADHETLAGLPEEGFRHGVAVIVGVELNRESNHYLVLGVDRLPRGNEEEPQEMIDRLNRAGALGFIAHPFEKGSPYIAGGKSYHWTRLPERGFTGLEIWNYTSYWRGRVTSIPRTIYWFLFNRAAAVDSPPPEALALWDDYTGRGMRVTAIGTSDAHAARVRVAGIPVEIFPYAFLFRQINTYLCFKEKMSGAFPEAKGQVYAALREGRCYLPHGALRSGLLRTAASFAAAVGRSCAAGRTAPASTAPRYTTALLRERRGRGFMPIPFTFAPRASGVLPAEHEVAPGGEAGQAQPFPEGKGDLLQAEEAKVVNKQGRDELADDNGGGGVGYAGARNARCNAENNQHPQHPSQIGVPGSIFQQVEMALPQPEKKKSGGNYRQPHHVNHESCFQVADNFAQGGVKRTLDGHGHAGQGGYDEG